MDPLAYAAHVLSLHCIGFTPNRKLQGKSVDSGPSRGGSSMCCSRSPRASMVPTLQTGITMMVNTMAQRSLRFKIKPPPGNDSMRCVFACDHPNCGCAVGGGARLSGVGLCAEKAAARRAAASSASICRTAARSASFAQSIMTGALLCARSAGVCTGLTGCCCRKRRGTARRGVPSGGADRTTSFGSMKRIMLVSGSAVGRDIRRTLASTMKRAACAAATAKKAPTRSRALCIQGHANKAHASSFFCANACQQFVPTPTAGLRTRQCREFPMTGVRRKCNISSAR